MRDANVERRHSRGWRAAVAEHEAVVAEFVRVIRAVGASRWHADRAGGGWTVAEEALHVALAYELGSRAGTPEARMTLRVPPVVAAFGRVILLPLALGLRRFPRGASSPVELLPDPGAAAELSPASLASRLDAAALSARAALEMADVSGPSVAVVHAYFGALDARQTLRLLSAHTRHHGARLTEHLAVR